MPYVIVRIMYIMTNMGSGTRSRELLANPRRQHNLSPTEPCSDRCAPWQRECELGQTAMDEGAERVGAAGAKQYYSTFLSILRAISPSRPT